MTTIAYKDGCLAGDTRVSDETGHIWTDNFRKVFRLKIGPCLFGASGDTESGEILLRALRKGIMMPPLPEDADINALLILPDKRIYMNEGNIWIPWPEKIAAVGSGKRAAMGAMRAGASAIQAVKAGIADDCYSGGRVQAVYLDKKEKNERTHTHRGRKVSIRPEDARSNPDEDR